MSKDSNAEVERLVSQLAVKDALIEAQNRKLKAVGQRLDTVEQYQKETIATAKISARRAKLESLAARGIELDIDDELETYAKFDDAVFERQLAKIETKYPKSLNGAPLIHAAYPEREDYEQKPEKLKDWSVDTREVENYSKSHPRLPGEDPVTYGTRMLRESKKK